MSFSNAFDFGGTKRYRVIRQLGEGGMGVVYEVEDRERNQTLALKTLKRRDPDTLYRLKREFRALADLSHPNLVDLYDLVIEDDACFVTMELIEGENFISFCRPGDLEAHGRDNPSSRKSNDWLDPTHPSVGPNLLAPGPVTKLYDERRLRHVLPQLAQGLHALHEAGRVHRDIKPSNVMVTGEERLVILDFGLVADEGADMDSLAGRIVGTVEYMAPEQAASEAVNAKADWYSSGVLLYEALTGQVPFSGPMMQVLLNKQQYPASPPRGLLPEVPEDLDALCLDLLAREPGRRPDALGVLKRLGINKTSRAQSHSMSMRTRLVSFSGRRDELDRLSDHYHRMRQGIAVVVALQGPSGIGKSALVQHFLAQLERGGERPVVLQGRCMEREAVPYKAMDGLVDQLARYWASLPKAGARELLPANPAILRRLFPTLGRVSVIAEAREFRKIEDPRELRNEAFNNLREVLQRLASRCSLVLFLDDLQWVDPDSVMLLVDLMRPPDPPGILLILSGRTQSELAHRFSDDLPSVGEIQDALSPESEHNEWGGGAYEQLLGSFDLEVERVEIAPLSYDAASTMASELLPGSDPAVAAKVAMEAGCVPFFISELAMYMQTVGPEEVGGVSLAQVLSERLEHLPTRSRNIVEAVVVAGEPISKRVLCSALEISSEDLERDVRFLRTAHFLRAPSGEAREMLEPYHNRIRETVRDEVAADDKRRLHHQLAVALEQWNEGTAAVLARHWYGAGDPQRAGELARSAADRLAETADFNRSSRLYKMAIEVGEYSPADMTALWQAFGESLGNAGHPLRAAEALNKAAIGRNPAQRLELHQRAASVLLRGGHIEEGMRAMADVLQEIDVKIAKSPVRALLSIAWRVGWLFVRGLRWKKRDPSDIDQWTLTKLDTLSSVSTSLAIVDHVRGMDFQVRFLLMVLKVGEPRRVGEALGMTAGYLAAQGREKLAKKFCKMARGVRESYKTSGAPFELWAEGGAEYFIHSQWRLGIEKLKLHEAKLLEKYQTGGWATDTSQLYSSFCRLYLGQLEELARTVPRMIQEADRRSDLYASVNLRTRLGLIWLMRDGYERADKEASRAIEAWGPPVMGYQVQHYFAFYSRCEVALYRGDWYRALGLIQAEEHSLKRSLLLHVPMVFMEYEYLKARVALMRGTFAHSSQLEDSVKTAKSALRKLGQAKPPVASGLYTLVEAGIANLSGNRSKAVHRLRKAIEQLEEYETYLYSRAARFCLGELIGGSEGKGLSEPAMEEMKGQGVTKPEKLSRMLVAGFAPRAMDSLRLGGLALGTAESSS